MWRHAVTWRAGALIPILAALQARQSGRATMASWVTRLSLLALLLALSATSTTALASMDRLWVPVTQRDGMPVPGEMVVAATASSHLHGTRQVHAVCTKAGAVRFFGVVQRPYDVSIGPLLYRGLQQVGDDVKSCRMTPDAQVLVLSWGDGTTELWTACAEPPSFQPAFPWSAHRSGFCRSSSSTAVFQGTRQVTVGAFASFVAVIHADGIHAVALHGGTFHRVALQVDASLGSVQALSWASTAVSGSMLVAVLKHPSSQESTLKAWAFGYSDRHGAFRLMPQQYDTTLDTSHLPVTRVFPGQPYGSCALSSELGRPGRAMDDPQIMLVERDDTTGRTIVLWTRCASMDGSPFMTIGKMMEVMTSPFDTPGDPNNRASGPVGAELAALDDVQLVFTGDNRIVVAAWTRGAASAVRVHRRVSTNQWQDTQEATRIELPPGCRVTDVHAYAFRHAYLLVTCLDGRLVHVRNFAYEPDSCAVPRSLDDDASSEAGVGLLFAGIVAPLILAGLPAALAWLHQHEQAISSSLSSPFTAYPPGSPLSPGAAPPPSPPLRGHDSSDDDDHESPVATPGADRRLDSRIVSMSLRYLPVVQFLMLAVVGMTALWALYQIVFCTRIPPDWYDLTRDVYRIRWRNLWSYDQYVRESGVLQSSPAGVLLLYSLVRALPLPLVRFLCALIHIAMIGLVLLIHRATMAPALLVLLPVLSFQLRYVAVVDASFDLLPSLLLLGCLYAVLRRRYALAVLGVAVTCTLSLRALVVIPFLVQMLLDAPAPAQKITLLVVATLALQLVVALPWIVDGGLVPYLQQVYASPWASAMWHSTATYRWLSVTAYQAYSFRILVLIVVIALIGVAALHHASVRRGLVSGSDATGVMAIARARVFALVYSFSTFVLLTVGWSGVSVGAISTFLYLLPLMLYIANVPLLLIVLIFAVYDLAWASASPEAQFLLLLCSLFIINIVVTGLTGFERLRFFGVVAQVRREFAASGACSSSSTSYSHASAGDSAGGNGFHAVDSNQVLPLAQRNRDRLQETKQHYLILGLLRGLGRMGVYEASPLLARQSDSVWKAD